MNEISALVCAVLTFVMAFLHLLLLCGVPLGEYVLGGTDRVIPWKKRRLNIFFLFIFLVLGIIYLNQTQYISLAIPTLANKIMMVVYTLFLAYAIIGNMFFTDSKKEKYLMTPLSVIGCISSILTLV